MTDMTTRELLKARYSRIRAEMVAEDMVYDHVPPVEEVTDEQWAADEAYLAKMTKGRSFTFTSLSTPDGPEDTVTTGTVAYWTEVLENPHGTFGDDSTVEEIREATEAEVIHFVMNGGIEDEDEADDEFQRGWDAYSEMNA